ncbi:hypothetical protein PI95_007630 [Hassallia byssoidea VB512170]|uniref:Uncharacterized protein n=1 Tax=Hassallia byssoidea VB512170 TaxID=1304833 RepID=A0A846H4A3_9CYAN|nr:hypothetical protein [Hassalia byssoidea]NEU72447.1 hypothetical protein [Hassalia byssoidea VB512170]
MTKPNFQVMTKKQLLAYMLEHREDNEAFYAYMDKVNAEPASEFYPAPQSIEDLKHFPQLLEKFRQEREKEA